MSVKSSPQTLPNRIRDHPQCLKQLRQRVPPLLISCMNAIFTFQRVNAGVKLLMPLETPNTAPFAAYVVKTDNI